MPRIACWNGYIFFFFSNEGIPLEPCHVHVRKGEKIAKVWIDKAIPVVAGNAGFNASELTEIEIITVEHKVEIRRKWNEYFGV